MTDDTPSCGQQSPSATVGPCEGTRRHLVPFASVGECYFGVVGRSFRRFVGGFERHDYGEVGRFVILRVANRHINVENYGYY